MIGLGLVALSVKETPVPRLSEDWSRNRRCSRWRDRPVRRPQRSTVTGDPAPHRPRSFPTLPALSRSLTMSTAPATTPLLRPTSARPQTAASSRPEGRSIIALLEGRGISREIGIATLNPETGRATIVQVRIYPDLLPTKNHSSHSHDFDSFQICPHMSRRYIKCISTTHLSSLSLTRLSLHIPRPMPRHPC